MDPSTLLQQLRAWDARRPSAPGEHWVTLALGLRLLSGRRGLLAKALGAALVWRALGGRDGIAPLLRRERGDTDGRHTTRLGGTVVASAAEPAPALGDSVRTAREDLRGDLAMTP